MFISGFDHECRRLQGCERLAQASEEVVLSFTEPGSDNSTRLVVLLNKAHQVRVGSECIKADPVLMIYRWPDKASTMNLCVSSSSHQPGKV